MGTPRPSSSSTTSALFAAARRDERVLFVGWRGHWRRPVAQQKLGDLGRVSAQCLFVQTAFRGASASRDGRRGVRTRPVLEHPFREIDAILGDGDVEEESSALAETTHVDHRPLRIFPVGMAPEGE